MKSGVLSLSTRCLSEVHACQMHREAKDDVVGSLSERRATINQRAEGPGWDEQGGRNDDVFADARDDAIQGPPDSPVRPLHVPPRLSSKSDSSRCLSDVRPEWSDTRRDSAASVTHRITRGPRRLPDEQLSSTLNQREASEGTALTQCSYESCSELPETSSCEEGSRSSRSSGTISSRTRHDDGFDWIASQALKLTGTSELLFRQAARCSSAQQKYEEISRNACRARSFKQDVVRRSRLGSEVCLSPTSAQDGPVDFCVRMPLHRADASVITLAASVDATSPQRLASCT